MHEQILKRYWTDELSKLFIKQRHLMVKLPAVHNFVDVLLVQYGFNDTQTPDMCRESIAEWLKLLYQVSNPFQVNWINNLTTRLQQVLST